MLLTTILSEARDSTVLIIAVLTFIVLIVYRRPLGEALSRLSHFNLRRGNTELSASTTAPVPTGSSPGDEEMPDDEDKNPEALLKDDDEDTANVTDSDEPAALRARMVSLLFAGKDAEAQEVRDKLLTVEPDQRTRKIDRVRWEAVRYMTGSAGPEAMQMMRRMAEEEDIKAASLLFIGHCLADAGQLREAVEAYTQSAQATNDPSARAEAIRAAASTLSKAGRGDEAVETLKQAIRNTTEDGALAELWQGLADAYEQLQSPELRGIALQKVVELRGNDSKVRFRTAWAFSEADSALAPLVVHHYAAMLRVSEDSMAMNNYGVQMERLKMPIQAVSLYETAADHQNTLAMANLAYLLMGAGFSTEAQELLEKAADLPSPHENVGSATATLAERKEKEEKKKKEILATGQMLAEFTREYAVGMIEETLTLDVGGEWVWSDGGSVAIDRSDQEALELKWLTGSTEFELAAKMNGRCARGVLRKKAKADSWASSIGEAFLILEPSGTSVRIAQVVESRVEVRTLQRRADQT